MIEPILTLLGPLAPYLPGASLAPEGDGREELAVPRLSRSAAASALALRGWLRAWGLPNRRAATAVRAFGVGAR